MVKTIIAEEIEKLSSHQGESKFESGKFDLVAVLFEQITASSEFPEFMTLVAYEHIN
jgi:malate synthase